MRSIPYREAVGSLLYIAICTRPDISYAVGVLSQFSSNPGMKHWTAVKHLMRYLKTTMDYKLTYAPDGSSDRFITYSDADFAGEHDSKRSTSGYVVKMGTRVVSWASRLQNIQTLSTTEAEYVSAVAAAQEVLWMKNLFFEFGYPIDTVPLHMDNQSAIQVAKNPEHHGRMKHLVLHHCKGNPRQRGRARMPKVQARGSVTRPEARRRRSELREPKPNQTKVRARGAMRKRFAEIPRRPR